MQPAIAKFIMGLFLVLFVPTVCLLLIASLRKCRHWRAHGWNHKDDLEAVGRQAELRVARKSWRGWIGRTPEGWGARLPKRQPEPPMSQFSRPARHIAAWQKAVHPPRSNRASADDNEAESELRRQMRLSDADKQASGPMPRPPSAVYAAYARPHRPGIVPPPHSLRASEADGILESGSDLKRQVSEEAFLNATISKLDMEFFDINRPKEGNKMNPLEQRPGDSSSDEGEGEPGFYWVTAESDYGKPIIRARFHNKEYSEGHESLGGYSLLRDGVPTASPQIIGIPRCSEHCHICKYVGPGHGMYFTLVDENGDARLIPQEEFNKMCNRRRDSDDGHTILASEICRRRGEDLEDGHITASEICRRRGDDSEDGHTYTTASDRTDDSEDGYTTASEN